MEREDAIDFYDKNETYEKAIVFSSEERRRLIKEIDFLRRRVIHLDASRNNLLSDIESLVWKYTDGGE